MTKKKHLLERWLTAYPEQLRPKQVMGKYRLADDNKRLTETDIQLIEAYWGGEIAAARLTDHLKPQIATIYVTGPLDQLLLKNRMQKDPNGNIEIIETFWDDTWLNLDGKRDMVPPLLVYADLLATGDPRNLETANLIYEQTIAGLIREDY